MTTLTFHKCKICGRIFYHGSKTTYCVKCVPSFHEKEYYTYAMLDNRSTLETRRALERERWRKRMENPKFREYERLRSLARYRADKKYAIKEEK